MDNGGKTGSFNAMDNLLADLKRRWPSLQSITVAGFSAGAQFVQHYVGFAQPPSGVRLRYVVADPGSWLYFDRLRPLPASWGSCGSEKTCRFRWQTLDAGRCPQANRWKFGLEALPAHLQRAADAARRRYAAADITYLPPPMIPAPRRAPTIGYSTNPAPPSCRAPIDCSAPWPTPTTIGVTWRPRSRIG
ncbi:hypothetical protein [Serratia marcescens]|uniref:hypothetical protein n=1 Tax=Serratia marcescens TaxID=615 RepID=UPI002237DB4E|nr:hypothetical protein [Serratia marcescens]